MPRILLIFLLPLAAFTLHKFYLSTTWVHQNLETGQLEVTVKLFTDDLERAIGNGKTLNLGEKNEAADADEILRTYLDRSFHLSVDGTTVAFHYLGKEAENDITYCYLESVGYTAGKKYTIHNEFLTSMFPEQKNMVDLELGEWKPSFAFTREHVDETIVKP